MSTHAVSIAPAGRQWPVVPALSLLLPAAAIIPVAAASGGFFPTAFGWTALAFSWVLLVAALLVVPRLRTLDAVWAISALSLCLFTFLSALWGGSAAAAVDAGMRTLVYATGVTAALLVLRRAEIERWLAGLVLGAAAVCVYALGTRLLPDHFGSYDPSAGYRLYTPIGYWNGLGIFAVIAGLAGLGLVIFGRGTALRVLSGVSLVVFLPTLYYTYSRGSWAALFAGLAVMVAYCPARLRLAAGSLVLGVLPALSVWLASRPAALTNRATPLAAATHAGHSLAVDLAVLAAAQVVIALVWALVLSRVSVSTGIRRGAGIALVAAGVVALALVIGRYGSPTTIVRHGYDSFTAAPTTSSTDLNNRLFSFSNNGRTVLWRAALNEYRDHPLAGGGAGSFQRSWYEQRTSAYTVQDAHNLYVQTLGELGVIGAALLAVFLAVPLVASWRARRHPLAAGALAAYAAFLLHAVVDWDWQLPAVTLLALFASATLVTAARAQREETPASVRRGVRATLAGLAVAAAVVSFVGLIGSIALLRAQSASIVVNGARVVSEAGTAYRWAPWSADALRMRGQGRLMVGARAAGLADLRHAARMDPESWETWFNLASATSGAERAHALARAKALNPHGPELALLAASNPS